MAKHTKLQFEICIFLISDNKSFALCIAQQTASIRQHAITKRNTSTWKNINYSLFEKRNTDPDYCIVSMRMRHIREINESHGYN